LTPGIVSPDGRRLYCLANISHDEEDDYHGLQGVLFRPRAGETEVPCASVFADGKTHPHWEGFTPIPLHWGCDDTEAIDACRQRIGEEHWEMLRSAVRQLNVPPVGHMLVLNGNLEPLKVLDSFGREVSSESLEGKSATGVSYGALTAGALFVGLGILVFGLGAMLLSLLVAAGGESPSLEELVPLLTFPGLGLVAIATGLCLRNRLWGSAAILFLFGGCLGIFYGVYASMQ
jgi:hypothetical protein